MSPSPQDWMVLAVFGTVYLGMILGGLPRLHLDRTGVALLGAMALVGAGVLTPEEAAQAIHLPTILLLFAFMVISAQMRLGGFYAHVARRMASMGLAGEGLLAVVIAVSAGLSAVFTNDIVCLAMAPVLVEACLRRRRDPVPYLLALACASNIGSAATLIGNPQNVLIGQSLRMDFAAYLRDAAVPVLQGLVGLWLVLRPQAGQGADLGDTIVADRSEDPTAPAFDRWQTAKGLVVAAALVVAFLVTDWPREVMALAGAGLLLLSQRFHSSRVMGLIDWELLVLFMGLFVVNHALQRTGMTGHSVQWLAAQGLDLQHTGVMFSATLLLSNLVSNVPAVMLLLPQAAQSPSGGLTLALVSTMAGNLLIVGSIANIIVVDAAARHGVVIDWRRHLRTGLPVTVITLALVGGWLHLLSWWRAH